MPVVPMQKINIVAHRSLKEELINFLQQREVVEIRGLKETPILTPETLKKIETYESQIAELKFAIDFLSRFKKRRKSFLETFVPPQIYIKEKDLEKIYQEFNFQKTLEACRNLDKKLSELKSLENKLDGEYEHLSPWKNLDIPLYEFREMEKIGLSLGILPAREWNNFIKEILIYTEKLQETKTKIYLALIYLKKDEEQVNKLLHHYGVERISLPEVKRTVREELEAIEKYKQEVAQDRDFYIKQAEELTQHILKLMSLHDYLLQKKIKLEVENGLVHTRDAFGLQGWIKKRDFKNLREDLAGISKAIEILEVSPEEGETPPVAIENREYLKPFETITRIYGMPLKTERDPTFALSFFFLLYFGLCLSDVGYGIVLAILSFWALKKLVLSEGGKRLMQLLFYGGLITIVAGALTGGWFGIDLETLPSTVRWIKALRVIDPIKNPLNMLILSLSLGVFQILTGITIQMIWKIKNKDYLSAILDNGFWLFFLFFLVSFVVAKALGSPLSQMTLYLTGIGALALILTQGRDQKNPLLKLAFGILSLYRTTSYLGDTLSYSRLLALGMTTSIIGMVVNIIANLARTSIPILGYVIMLAVLIFGHSFNLLVSVLGAFIHSLRLQLVEYFGKFFEGGGKPFRPFRRETKYIVIQ